MRLVFFRHIRHLITVFFTIIAEVNYRLEFINETLYYIYITPQVLLFPYVYTNYHC